MLSAANMYGFWWYKANTDIRLGSLVRWCQMRMRSSKMRVFSFDRYIGCMKFMALHIKIYTASRGFPATARLLLLIVGLWSLYLFKYHMRPKLLCLGM